MTWVLNPFQGTASEVETDLQTEIQNQREEQIIPVVKKSISDIVEALGGYISISANGHFNPASGEPGDVVTIHISSLPEPNAPTPPPVEVPPAVEAPPVLTSQEAVAQNQQELRPEGSVAPPTGSAAPGNGGGLPGLETAPTPPAAPVEEAPVAEAPVVVDTTGEGINNPPAITDPVPVDPAQVNPENPDVAPTHDEVLAGETVTQNPPAENSPENVAQPASPETVVPAESAPIVPDITESPQLDGQGDAVTPV